MWSWILTAVGLTGFYLAGRRVWWCWYINLACQGLWFTYALVTKQYGFIAASIVYSIIFAQNAIKWTKEHREKPCTCPNTPDVTVAMRDSTGQHLWKCPRSG